MNSEFRKEITGLFLGKVFVVAEVVPEISSA